MCRYWWIPILLGGGGWVGYRFVESRPVRYPAGHYVPGFPVQKADSTWHRKLLGFRLESVAQYQVRARLLKQTDYRTSYSSRISPIDYALGWDRAGDQAIIDLLTIELDQRFVHYQLRENSIVYPEELQRKIGNTHLIPASESIRRKLRSVKAGHFVELRGYLVNVFNADGFAWRTSTRRDDVGGGACEILFVESVKVIEPRRVRA